MKQRADNRTSMPVVAAFVDELRAQGLAVRVLYAKENGVAVGKRPAEENAFDIPAGYGLTTAKEGGRAR